MSEVCASLIAIMRLNAERSVSVILLANPHKRKSEVTKIKGLMYCFSNDFMAIGFSLV